MKKLLTICLALCLLLSFAACSNVSSPAAATAAPSAEPTAAPAAEISAESVETEAPVEAESEPEAEPVPEADPFAIEPYTGAHASVRLGCLEDDFSLSVSYSLGFLEAAFKGSDVSFSLRYYADDAAVSAALASGEIDLAVCSEQTILTGALYGSGCRIIARSLLTKANVPLMAYVNITSPEMLQGQPVALRRGSWCHFLLLQYLESVGLGAESVYIIDTNIVTNPLTSGLAHAAVDPEADYSQLLSWGRIYELTDDIAPNARALRVIAGCGEFLDKYPEIVADILHLEQAVTDWYLENEENSREAAQVLSDISGMDSNTVLSLYNSDKLGTSLNDQDMEALRSLMSFMSTYGQFPGSAPSFEEAVSTEYLSLAGLQ